MSTSDVAPPPAGPPPHLERLLARLRELEGPVIQVWAWPGSGAQILLEGLLAAEGPAARPLAVAELESEDRLREALGDPSVAGSRWLVGLRLPERVLAAAGRLLRPGQRLLHAARRRPAGGGLPVSLLPPAELLLTPEEMAALWRRRTGAAPKPGTVERLRDLTSGWWRPLELVAGATAAGELGHLTAEAILALPAADAFFRHEVVGSLPVEVAAALGRLAGGGRPPAKAAAELERHGWRPPGGGGLPELLVHFVTRDLGPSLTVSPGERGQPGFRLALLGPPRVTVLEGGRAGSGGDAGAEVRWPLRRTLKILALLASSPGFEIPRDELVAAIWPEDDEDHIARNLHPTLSHLRRALARAWREATGGELPPPLNLVHRSYRLSPEITWRLDTEELAAGIEEGRRRRDDGDLEAAVAAWELAARQVRGPFLQGVYDAWAEGPRERYQRAYLDLLRETGDVYTELERWTEALDSYRRVLIEDPLRERVHVALMRLYARQRRRDLVRRQYDKLTALLAEDLGVEPLPETTEEYHRLMG